MSYGQGTITFERGKWRVRIPDGRGGYISGGSYDTRAQAERMRDVLLLERGDCSALGVSLHDYGSRVIGRWIAAGQRDAKAMRSRWKCIVGPAPFARSPLPSIARHEIRDWARGLQSTTGKSWQTCKHALGLVGRVLQEAVEDGHLQVNPAAGVELPRRQDRAEGWAWLTQAELDAVLQSELTAEQRTAITLAVYQGLRQGELAALQWQHVDLQAGWLVIAGSWDTGTKSGRVRRIPILAPAADALQAWRPDPRTRTGYVLPGAAGGCYSRGYDWGWGDRRNHGGKGIPERAGVKRRVRWHDLRHTCAAHLVSGSWGKAWTLQEVREFLGHSEESVTARYAHLCPDALQATARATAAAKPAANPPHDSDHLRKAALQMLDFLRENQQAVGGSNARPLAPEAKGSQVIPRTSPASRQVRGRFTASDLALQLLRTVEAGAPVPQSLLDALAAAVLDAPTTLRALTALAAGPDAVASGLALAATLRIEQPSRGAAGGRQ